MLLNLFSETDGNGFLGEMGGGLNGRVSGGRTTWLFSGTGSRTCRYSLH